VSPRTSATIATFALAALPGVIVLEIYEFGRPRIRERNPARAFAVYWSSVCSLGSLPLSSSTPTAAWARS